MLSIAIWSQVLVPGQRVTVVPECDFRLTTATFGEELADEKGRSTLKLYRAKAKEDDEDDDEEEDEEDIEFETEAVVFGALVPGKIETLQLDLIFTEDEPIEFEVTGKNKIYLVGNYIEQNPIGPSPTFPDSDSEDASDYDLNDVSSDVEINVADLMEEDVESADEVHNRIEEVAAVVEPPKKEKSKKRARESDVADVEEQPKSKKEKKKEKKEKEKAGDKTDESSPAKPETKEKSKTDKHTTKSGVIVDVRAPGKGPVSKPGQRLKMRYIGKLADGSVFDKNTKGAPFAFTLGKGEVIKGWDEGLVGLAAGSEAILTIPPSAGYGGKKVDKIPANSTLKFEVKLLSIN